MKLYTRQKIWIVVELITVIAATVQLFIAPSPQYIISIGLGFLLAHIFIDIQELKKKPRGVAP